VNRTARAAAEADEFMGVRVLTLVIDLYRLLVSPLFPPSCRFEPSCSLYAKQALARHGLRGGGWLALRRILRCHPWHPGGADPVP
jgi:putative membrane protein insertion efficiency factor